MYNDYKKNLDHTFAAGQLVQHSFTTGWPVETWLVTKATFYHGHSGYADRWDLHLTNTVTGRETKTSGCLVDLIPAG